jgi:hypothetical protein
LYLFFRALAKEVSHLFDLDVNLARIYELDDEYAFFVKMAGLGIIGGTNYYKVIQNYYKFVYYPKKDYLDDAGVHTSTVGDLYKSKPILGYISKVEFNAKFREVYGEVKFPGCEEGNYADYFVRFFADKPVFDKLDEIDVTIYSNMDIASIIAEGNKEFTELAKKQLSKSRLTSVIMLLKAMRERV